MENKMKTTDFDAIKISIASPEEIIDWSCGEILKPETINYRTQKPEKDGLFCERIFGPTKDWECYCGKYKRIRYKGIICDKCGVEVTRSIVRRERMGHIKLATPVSHIWYLRSTPSRIGLLLNMSQRDLERVIYFANFIITSVDEKAKQKLVSDLKKEFQKKSKEKKEELDKKLKQIKKDKVAELKSKKGKAKEEVIKRYNQEISAFKQQLDIEDEELESARLIAFEELNFIQPLKIISEGQYIDWKQKYGDVFSAGIGTEAIYDVIKKIDLKKLALEIEKGIEESSGQKKKKILTRLRLVSSFIKAKIRPEWMFLSVVPVIPPDLRPMVQLDGGRFATSDLNDLYRRVINRNNRLKRLIDLGAPEVICRNEKRMLQEAVDALIDNEARRGKAVTVSTTRRKLKSLSDILRGKQGRFRQNLLGKRVDYSGRSVIVIGPDLKLHQCGLPKKMALELFKPFVIGRLIREGYAHNVKIAGRMIEKALPEVWDMLEKVISRYYVLLNRAPTLHRLGIQAFQPVLVEGNAIQIHPLVCQAFNADFDGDQMAVHVPLSILAQREAKEIMLSSNNLLKPGSGDPVVIPTQDMILGCYYVTLIRPDTLGEGKIFSYPEEALLAYQKDILHIQAKIKVKIQNKIIETTVGRIIFNETLPPGIEFQNQIMDNKSLKKLIGECFCKLGNEQTAKFVDRVKNVGFEFATKSGLSISVDDIQVPPKKDEIIKNTEQKSQEIRNQYKKGLITDYERYTKNVELWTRAKDEIEDEMMKGLDKYGSISSMVSSGARGNKKQIVQLGGMKGLVVNPAGQTIELPIKANFREGFSVLEYFISTHGARKGKSDTALKTSDSGYLTRRLVDVSQDIIVYEKDCSDRKGIDINRKESKELDLTFSDLVVGRYTTEDVLDPKNKNILIKKDQEITENNVKEIENSDIQTIKVRSVISCRSTWGVCQKCYGRDLSKGKIVDLGEAVGIIAAQSIGEPGTQLTMRTFHTGGIAEEDITQGLPRVEELFEARNPKGEAVMSEVSGKVSIVQKDDNKIVTVIPENINFKEYPIKKGYKVKVKNGQNVSSKKEIMEAHGKSIKADIDGCVQVKKDKVIISQSDEKPQEYEIPVHLILRVKSQEKVKAGQPLTEGNLNLQKMFEILKEKPVQKYIVSEAQKIYASQGQSINNKHIEVIVRQMFSKVRIKETGDTNFLPGGIVDKNSFIEMNNQMKKKNKKQASCDPLLLGITKASLETSSFLSAASFQETTRVLVQAAVTGSVDRLRGLKENVIIGRLIPAGTGYKKEWKE